jgi:hypothetical protein
LQNTMPLGEFIKAGVIRRSPQLLLCARQTIA